MIHWQYIYDIKTISLSKSSKETRPSDNLDFKIPDTKHFYIKKVKNNELTNSHYCSPTSDPLKIWKILTTAGETIWSNPQT